jgi:hypothetical protein
VTVVKPFESTCTGEILGDSRCSIQGKSLVSGFFEGEAICADPETAIAA